MSKKNFIDNEDIINAQIVCEYFPRIYYRDLTEKQKEAFVEVYNCLLDELIDREVLRNERTYRKVD